MSRYFNIDGGKGDFAGDSVSFTFHTDNHVKSVSRYSVTKEKGKRSASRIYHEDYLYNQDGTIKSKTIATYTYYYTYDSLKHLVKVKCFMAGAKLPDQIDSIGWIRDGDRYVAGHWAVSRKTSWKVKIDEIVLDARSGKELMYSLFLPDKFNYIRDLTGPLSLGKEYDGSGKLIRSWVQTINGNITYERRIDYSTVQVPSSMTYMRMYFPLIAEYDKSMDSDEESRFDEMPEEELEAILNPDLDTVSYFTRSKLTYHYDMSGVKLDFIEVSLLLEHVENGNRSVVGRAPGIGRVYFTNEYYE